MIKLNYFLTSCAIFVGASFGIALPTQSFASQCQMSHVHKYIADDISIYIKYPKLEMNNNNIKNKNIFFDAYYRPYDAKAVIDAITMLETDTVKQSEETIVKPKILYSKMSLYEKSKYSMKELKRLKKEEEIYNFKIQKLKKIAKGTRSFNPILENRSVYDLIVISGIFTKSKDLKSMLIDTLHNNGMYSRLSKLAAGNYLEELFKINVGIYDDVNEELINEKLKKYKNNPDLYYQKFFYEVAVHGVIPAMTDQERKSAQDTYKWILSKCEGKDVLPNSTLDLAMQMYAIAKSIGGKAYYDLYAAYLRFFPAHSNLWSFFELWVSNKIQKSDHLDVGSKIICYENKKSFFWRDYKQEIKNIITMIKDSSLSDYTKFWITSLSINTCPDPEVKVDLKKLLSITSLSLQKHFSKKKDIMEAMYIYKKTQEMLKK